MDKHFGELEPRYRFFLNKFRDARWTSCPECERKMGQRKCPLVIGVGSGESAVGIFCLNFTCRYCKNCDLLITHQDKLEPHIQRYLEMMGVFGDPTDFFVLGTMDRADWRAGVTDPRAFKDIRGLTHDFCDYVAYEMRYGWGPAEPVTSSE